MELTFDTTTVSCLDTWTPPVKSTELIYQLRLPEGMPDVGRVIAAWGQPVLRSKEWSAADVCASGGMMVWILYAPEDGTREQCIDCWIPFQIKWDLPEGMPEGRIRLQLCHKNVDARSASPRKLVLRCLLRAAAEVFSHREQFVSVPKDTDAQLELLRKDYPLMLGVEAGEKVVSLEETLALPDSAPLPDKLICASLEPVITEQRVLGDKVLFRGNGNLHLLYRSEEGQIHSWDQALDFSQFEELDRERGAEAAADIVPAVTTLEAELDDSGHFQIRCSVVCQYRILDRVMVRLAEDAYSLSAELQVHMDTAEFPVQLERRRETVRAEQSIPAEGNLAVEARFFPDCPGISRQEQETVLELPGVFQVLYYDQDRTLRSAAISWEGQRSLRAEENCRIQARMLPAQIQTSLSGGQIRVYGEIPLETNTMVRQQFPMVTGAVLGQPIQKDPDRPALILCRAGSVSLWQIARDSGSTPEAICKANALTEEPEPGRMLLIPVL